MKRQRKFQIGTDTNVAFSIIKAVEKSKDAEDKEQFLSNLVANETEDLKTYTNKFFNYVKDKITQYKEIVKKYDGRLKSETQGKMLPKNAEDMFNKIVKHYNTTTDEEQKVLSIKLMGNVFKCAKAYAKDYVEKDNFSQDEAVARLNVKRDLENQINDLGEKIEILKESYISFTKDSEDAANIFNTIKNLISKRHELSQKLRNEFTINESWKYEDNKYNEMYVSLNKKFVDICGIKLCQKNDKR